MVSAVEDRSSDSPILVVAWEATSLMIEEYSRHRRDRSVMDAEFRLICVSTVSTVLSISMPFILLGLLMTSRFVGLTLG